MHETLTSTFSCLLKETRWLLLMYNSSEEMHKNLEQRRQQAILSVSKQFDTSAITGAKTYLLRHHELICQMHNHT